MLLPLVGSSTNCWSAADDVISQSRDASGEEEVGVLISQFTSGTLKSPQRMISVLSGMERKESCRVLR